MSQRVTRSKTKAAATAAGNKPKRGVQFLPETVCYPLGCKPVTSDLADGELISRLRALISHLECTKKQQYCDADLFIPLIRHLTGGPFLKHLNQEVRLGVASCIANLLRIFGPKLPYKNPEQWVETFLFLIDELEGLTDPTDSNFTQCSDILQDLKDAKSFRICCDDLPKNSVRTIVKALFKQMFEVVGSDSDVYQMIMDLLCILGEEHSNDVISFDVLCIILPNLASSVNRWLTYAYNLAKSIIRQWSNSNSKSSEILKTEVKNFFCQIFVWKNKRTAGELNMSTTTVYEVMQEVYVIFPELVINQLLHLPGYDLDSDDEMERLSSVTFLSRLFSDNGSTLAQNYQVLWTKFLGRFNDCSVSIRIKCVQSWTNLFANHGLRDVVVETLKHRRLEDDENVRREMVKSIADAAMLDLTFVSQTNFLLDYLLERTFDVKFMVRQQALHGLANIYKKFVLSEYSAEMTRVKDAIFQAYRLQLEDKIVVERLFNTCLVPFQLQSRGRMIRMLCFFGTLNHSASEAFCTAHKFMKLIREHMELLMVDILSNPLSTIKFEGTIKARILTVSNLCVDKTDAFKVLWKFMDKLRTSYVTREAMEKLLNPDCSIQSYLESSAVILSTLEFPSSDCMIIRILLERMGTILVDRQAIMNLIEILHAVNSGDPGILKNLGMGRAQAIERGLVLLYLFSTSSPQLFTETAIHWLIDLYTKLENWLQLQSQVLVIITDIGNKNYGIPSTDVQVQALTSNPANVELQPTTE